MFRNTCPNSCNFVLEKTCEQPRTEPKHINGHTFASSSSASIKRTNQQNQQPQLTTSLKTTTTPITTNMSGRIEVRLVEGRGLRDQDKVGTNDSYVELYLVSALFPQTSVLFLFFKIHSLTNSFNAEQDEDYKQASSTVSNTNDPAWNDTFTFQTGGKHKLYIKALDKDVGDKDKIGEATLDVGPALNGAVIDGEFLGVFVCLVFCCCFVFGGMVMWCT